MAETLPPFPPIDPKDSIPYESIRYVAGYWEGYVKQYAADFARAAIKAEREACAWVKVDDRLPEPNVEVLCAGKGWADSFVTCCYYDAEQKGWWQIGSHWTDAHDGQQYPTHWAPLPPPPVDD